MMYYNRDLSWLGFNYRVLREAACPSVPLFERFRFLSIFSSNLDEFFRVRYPAILALTQLSEKTRKKIAGEAHEEIINQVQAEINQQQKEFGEILVGGLLPELERNHMILYYNRPFLPEHIPEMREIFLTRILGFVQPVFIEGNPNQDFRPENNQLYLINTLKKAGESHLHHAIVKIPTDHQPRFFVLQPLNDRKYIAFIDDIIKANLDCVFPGFEITGSHSVKFNRDAELNLEDEYTGDLLKKIEKQLKKRDFGPPTRFLYEESIPRNVLMFLASSFEITYDEMYPGRHYHNLRDLEKLPVFQPEFRYPKRKPLSAPQLHHCSDIFYLLEKKDVLLHFPYDSYNPLLAFFNQAAIDPFVDEIYIALYRIATDSLIVYALMSAARNGKNVTVFMELKARFDEANNIFWSKRMKQAGIRIIYSIPEIKVHSKIALIIKRDDSLNRKTYSVLSTGNFNEITAKLYTDHTLLTTDPSINNAIFSLFQFLKKRKKPGDTNKLQFQKLLVSQFNMMEGFERLIEKEIKSAEQGQPGRIRIKLNNLEESHMIALLYKASQAGVQVQLIVRSICCLVPGLHKFSDSIEVRRIIGRYLEHTRIFIFGEESPTVIMGSADWMTRNLHHRIEVCAEVKDPGCRGELIDYFDIQWQDNEKAVRLLPNMEQEKIENNRPAVSAQDSIYHYLQGRL